MSEGEAEGEKARELRSGTESTSCGVLKAYIQIMEPSHLVFIVFFFFAQSKD